MKKMIIVLTLIAVFASYGSVFAFTGGAFAKIPEIIFVKPEYTIEISREDNHIIVLGKIKISGAPREICKNATGYADPDSRIKYVLEKIGVPTEKQFLFVSIKCNNFGTITVRFRLVLPNKNYSIDDIDKIVELIKTHLSK